MVRMGRMMLGMGEGNFQAKCHTKHEFTALMEMVLEKKLPKHIISIHAPRTDFTATITNGDDVDAWSPQFTRTKSYADGCIIANPATAVAIFNGDGPVLCLRQDQRLAVLHIGYRCMMQSNPQQEGIIEVAMRHHQFDPKEVTAHIFGGIGPCCWMAECSVDKPEIGDPDLSRHPDILRSCRERTIFTCPFGSQHISVNLQHMASSLLQLMGVPENRITCEHACTCHAKEGTRPKFWSHTRYKALQLRSPSKDNVDGRNACLVWLE